MVESEEKSLTVVATRIAVDYDVGGGGDCEGGKRELRAELHWEVVIVKDMDGWMMGLDKRHH